MVNAVCAVVNSETIAANCAVDGAVGPVAAVGPVGTVGAVGPVGATPTGDAEEIQVDVDADQYHHILKAD